jgi:TatA/E family protein of Tat protein translocase
LFHLAGCKAVPVHLVGTALVVFGPRRLPELGKPLGESIHGLKRALNEGEGDSTKSN